MKVKPIWISNSKGETGIQGIQGNTGLNGVTGLNGAPGVIGLDGVTGVIGATGFQGVTGIGVTGSKGETGAQGTVGQIGFTGFQGVTGFLGEQGETGLGIIGITGEQGVQGVTGIAPEPSECAYIYYQGKYITSLSANQTMFGSDMPTIDENEFVSSVSGEIYLDYVNGGFKVPSDIRFINVSLNFAFGFTTGDSGVYKDFRYNLVSGDEGFGATGTDTKIIASGSIQPPDTVDSYTSCSAITVDTDTFGKYINVIWLGDTIDPEEIQFSISLNSIAGIQGETGTSDHLILRSIDDTVPGFIKDKLTSDEYLNISDVTEEDIKKLLIALKDPLYYVKGSTIYGGSLVTTLNEFTRTTFFTCYYNATGAPPIQAGNPSWFGIHINSNAGVTSGLDMAWAYLTNGIICYERSKVANVFGGWQLRGSAIKQTAVNKTGTDMTKGTAVALYGSSGERVKLNLLVSTQTVSEQIIVAILDENIANNAEGPVTRSGRLVMDTNSWNEGDILYASTTPGVLSNVAPAKGYSYIPVGIVIKKAGATDGIVFVNPFPVPRISQLPDVSVSGATDGQVLTFQSSTGLWIPGTGGSSIWGVSHIASMDGGGASDNIALQAGSSTQWSAHGVMTAPFGQITPVAEQSTLGFIAAQVATGSFISAIYKVEDTGVHSLICESAVTAFPASAAWVNALVLSVETGLYIPANERVYMVIMTNANGVSLAGKSASNLNLQPYVAGIKTNMGVLTAAPKTLQWESETNTRPFIYMTK